MRITFIFILFICIACGPSAEEKIELEKDIQGIKEEMALLLHNSKELTVRFVRHKSQIENVDLAEKGLAKVRTKMQNSTAGSQEYQALEAAEQRGIKSVDFEKDSLNRMGNIDSIQTQLQTYSKRYDSLQTELNKKIQLLE